MTITEDETKADTLLSEDALFNLVSSTASLKSVYLQMDGSEHSPEFVLPPGWNVGLNDKDPLESTEAKMLMDGSQYTLSKEAALGIAHAVGMTPAYVTKTPGVLIANHLNYWAKHSPDLGLKMLVKDTTALTVMKQSIVPFSNIELLERALESLGEALQVESDEIYGDPKSYHDLHTTSLRLVSDKLKFPMGDDFWLGGIQIRNSTVGKFPLSVHGYLYRKGEENALIMHTGAQRYNRKIQGQDEFEVLQWLADAIKEIVEVLDHEANVVNSLREESIADAVAIVTADACKTYKIPLKVRTTMTDNLIESGDLTYYGLINALTETACDEDLPEHYVTTIMEIGGALAADAHKRCNACKQVVV